jgi:hypothetical protein
MVIFTPRPAVGVDVNRGFYEVLLGDPTLANMRPLSPVVFTNADLYLRVWFSTGAGPYLAVTPDQPMAAAGYAMISARVADGAVTAASLAEGSVTAGKLAPNAVTGANIAPAAIGATELAPNAAAANLESSGGLILSPQANATPLIQAGFKIIGTVAAERESWSSNSVYCPWPRAGHLAVWTGKEFIVLTLTPLSPGNRFDPARDIWAPIAPANAPARRIQAEAVWTGSEILLFGGMLNNHSLPTETFRYSLSTDLFLYGRP